MTTDTDSKRVFYIDLIRGLCVLLMIVDHFMFDCAYILPEINSSPFIDAMYSAGHYYWVHPVRQVVRGIVVSTFYFLCGISSSLSRNNLKRAIKLLIVSAIITAVTLPIDIISGYQGFVIWFGTIHMLTVAVFSVVLIELIKNEKIKVAVYLVAATVMIVLHAVLFNPEYENTFGAILGIGYPATNTADMTGIMPFVGIVFLGVVFGKLLKKKQLLKPCEPPKLLRPACFVGRYALLTYLLHQPALMIIILLLSLF